jgi:hypothetical protein
MTTVIEACPFQRIPTSIPKHLRNVTIQALAGLLWNKQFYFYCVEDWLTGKQNFSDQPIRGLMFGHQVKDIVVAICYHWWPINL